jgi:hypothetical protein
MQGFVLFCNLKAVSLVLPLCLQIGGQVARAVNVSQEAAAVTVLEFSPPLLPAGTWPAQLLVAGYGLARPALRSTAATMNIR